MKITPVNETAEKKMDKTTTANEMAVDKNPDNLFEELPIKARKRRRVVVPTPTPAVATEKPEKQLLPVTAPPPPNGTTTTTAIYHVPGGGTGVGIAPLDTSLLCGSQRIGIIGLPDARSSYRRVRRPGVPERVKARAANPCCRTSHQTIR